MPKKNPKSGWKARDKAYRTGQNEKAKANLKKKKLMADDDYPARYEGGNEHTDRCRSLGCPCFSEGFNAAASELAIQAVHAALSADAPSPGLIPVWLTPEVADHWSFCSADTSNAHALAEACRAALFAVDLCPHEPVPKQGN
jgi:hypothetical protein